MRCGLLTTNRGVSLKFRSTSSAAKGAALEFAPARGKTPCDPARREFVQRTIDLVNSWRRKAYMGCGKSEPAAGHANDVTSASPLNSKRCMASRLVLRKLLN